MNAKIFSIVALLAAGLVSCTKTESINGGSVWTGEYQVQTLNGTTGELENQTASIMLVFNHGDLDCDVYHGLSGMYGTNRINYEVRWSSSEHFGLWRTSADQSVLEYSGTISGSKMSLEALNCDSVAATYELKKVKVE